MATQTIEQTDTFSLSAPEPVKAPTIAQVKTGLVAVDDKAKPELDSRVDQFVGELLALDANSPQFGA